MREVYILGPVEFKEVLRLFIPNRQCLPGHWLYIIIRKNKLIHKEHSEHMHRFDPEMIQNQVADSSIIFQRGRRLYEYGAYSCIEHDPDQGRFVYEVDG